MPSKVRITPLQNDILEKMHDGWKLTTTYVSKSKRVSTITNGTVTLLLQADTVSSIIDRGMIGKKQDKEVNYRVVRTWKLTARGDEWVKKRLARRGGN